MSKEVVIDARSVLTAEALRKSLELTRPDLGVRLIYQPKQREGLLNQLLGLTTAGEANPMPDLIMQELTLLDFEWGAHWNFEFLGSTRDGRGDWSEDRISSQRSHPLRYRLESRELRRMAANGERLDSRYARFSVPIIYFGDFDLVGYLNSEEGKDTCSERSVKKGKKSSDFSTAHEGQLAFLDSSIWHRYHFVLDQLQELLRIIDSILEKWSRLYGTNVALEYLDYSIRSLRGSRLDQFSHGKWISLSSFRSETRMKLDAGQIVKKITGAPKAACLQRRMLVVDDFANEKLTRVEGAESDTGQATTKVNIIKTVLNELCEIKQEWKSSECVLKAQGLLENEDCFDLILLDYLLGKSEDGGGRELGTTLLDSLQKREEGRRGPLERFWVFPISSFSYALQAEIASGRILNLDTAYVLGSGADPVCTPHLFQRQFFQFLKVQIDHAMATKKDLSRFLEVLARDLKTWGYEAGKAPDETTHGKVRGWARFWYPLAVIRSGRFYQLERQKERKSLFAAQVLEGDQKCELRNVYSHFVRILRLIGWGTGIEWPRISDEATHMEHLLNNQGLLEDSSFVLGCIQQHVASLAKEFG